MEKVSIRQVDDTGRLTKAGDPILKVLLQDGREGSAFDRRFMELDLLDEYEVDIRSKGLFNGKEDFVFNLPKNFKPLHAVTESIVHSPELTVKTTKNGTYKVAGESLEFTAQVVEHNLAASTPEEPVVAKSATSMPDMAHMAKMSSTVDKKETVVKDSFTTQKGTSLVPWLNALEEAKGKFLALTGLETEARIEVGFATQMMEDNPRLKSCSKESIVNAIINVAATGITLNPVLQLAYLIPRKGKCSLDFSYRGLVKILKDYGCILDMQAVVVYEDEEFQEGISQLDPPKHVKRYAKTKEEQKNRKYLGVYCQVVLPDKNKTVIYTQLKPNWEILEAKAASQSGDSPDSAWVRYEVDMYKKTKIKADFKTLISGSPKKNELANLAKAMDEEDAQSGEVKVTGKMKKSVVADIFGDSEEVQPVSQESETVDDFIKSGPDTKSKRKQK